MKLINKQHWADRCEYWTDNGFYILLEDFFNGNVGISIFPIVDGTVKHGWNIGLEKFKSKHNNGFAFTVLAQKLVANGGREIIVRLFREQIKRALQ